MLFGQPNDLVTVQPLPFLTPEATLARPNTPELDQWSGHGQLNGKSVIAGEIACCLTSLPNATENGQLNDFVDVASRPMQHLKPQPSSCNSREPDTDYDDAR
ncbi:hypothetical protein K525DRAFT_275085 [Schizophyllum commune Loenen D]|nr:hypothetical protein K525DRAFT_275085 [Schizophyllum commune Loenen D]